MFGRVSPRIANVLVAVVAAVLQFAGARAGDQPQPPDILAIALTGVVVGLAAEAFGAAASTVALSTHDLPLHWGDPAVREAILAVPLLAALHGVLGVGLGLLLRNVAAALGIALMWAFVVEGALPVLVRAPALMRWLPGEAAHAVLNAASSTTTTLSAGAALAVLTGYAVALVAGGALGTVRREVGTATG